MDSHVTSTSVNLIHLVLSKEDFLGIILQLIRDTKEHKYDCYPDYIARFTKTYIHPTSEQLLVSNLSLMNL